MADCGLKPEKAIRGSMAHEKQSALRLLRGAALLVTAPSPHMLPGRFLRRQLNGAGRMAGEGHTLARPVPRQPL